MTEQAHRRMHDSCNSLCLPSCLGLYCALRPVLRCRIGDVSKCPSCPYLLAFQLCEKAAIVAYSAQCLSGADEPSLLTVVARSFCHGCSKNPLAFQVPPCEYPCILVLHLSILTQHLAVVNCLTRSPVV